MNDDAATAAYEFVERVYVRLEAGEVINHCLDHCDTAPLKTLVEGLVMVGPQSLAVLRELISEAASRKVQLQEARNTIFRKLILNLRECGVKLEGQYTSFNITRLTPAKFGDILRQHSVTDERVLDRCLRLVNESLELLGGLDENFRLLEEIEEYTQDWLWVLIYQAARQEWTDFSGSAPTTTQM